MVMLLWCFVLSCVAGCVEMGNEQVLKVLRPLLVGLLLAWGSAAHATIITYEGTFSGVFSDEPTMGAFAASWALTIDDSLPIVGNTVNGVQEGEVTTVAFVPSPAGPIAIPYPNGKVEPCHLSRSGLDSRQPRIAASTARRAS